MRLPDHLLKRALLLGIGLDNRDGHTRITTGGNFFLVGGSEETHAEMQEKSVKFNEELDKKVKTLEDLSFEEFVEIARQVKMLQGGQIRALRRRSPPA